jgi:hypothetical protein
MEDLNGEALVLHRLKPYFLCYAVITVVFLSALCGALILNARATALEREGDKLRTFNIGLSKAPHTIHDANVFLGQLSTTIPANILDESPSHFLHAGLDRTKSIMGGGQLIVGRMEERDDETVMPVTLSGSLTDYSGFVTALGQLEVMYFPFFTAKGLAVKMNRDTKDETRPSYEISGELMMPKFGTEGEHPSQKGSVRGQ